MVYRQVHFYCDLRTLLLVVRSRGDAEWFVVFGSVHAVDALDEEERRQVEELQTLLAKSKYISNKATYLSWIKDFKDGAEKNILCQVVAFLAYWLS